MSSCTELVLGSGIEASSTNRTNGADITLTCVDFAHRIVGNGSVTCNAGTWSVDTSKVKCEWSWDFSTHEKLVFGTSIAAVGFVILMIIVIVIAYCVCYRRRNEDDKSGFDDNVSPHLKNENYDHYGNAVSVGSTDPSNNAYYAYQEHPESPKNNNWGYDNWGQDAPTSDVSGINKPWMGYIPRPKIADNNRTYYNS
ncbi:hypothetical protein SNE40_013237 [Patella caerulea]|uniref:Sushi domain-containing protein n=1 Tax=Patella caerulea TaxID=87958 RepID=A0AAN8JR15_PATCE